MSRYLGAVRNVGVEGFGRDRLADECTPPQAHLKPKLEGHLAKREEIYE